MTTYEEDRREVCEWARTMLLGCVILDTETTGLYDAEIVQIAVIDQDGAVLLDSLVEPPHPEKALKKHKGVCAADIHGLTPDKLKGAPTWTDIWPRLVEALAGRNLVIYNADYDWPIIRTMCDAYGLSTLPPHASIHCAMENYAAFVGEWNDYFGSYRWQRLPGGDHSALGDCRATLAVLKEMAEVSEA